MLGPSLMLGGRALASIANGDGSESLSVSSVIRGVVTVTKSDTTSIPQGRGIIIVATVGGNLAMVFEDGSTLTVPFAIGLTVLPFAPVKLMATGSTGTATFAVAL